MVLPEEEAEEAAEEAEADIVPALPQAVRPAREMAHSSAVRERRERFII